MAFANYRIENLIGLIKMYKEEPSLLKRWDPSRYIAGDLCRMDTLRAPSRELLDPHATWNPVCTLLLLYNKNLIIVN